MHELARGKPMWWMMLAMQVWEPDPAKVQESAAIVIAWQSCVTSIARSHAQGRDSAGDIADAALATCQSLEQRYVRNMADALEPSPDVSFDQAQGLARRSMLERRAHLRGMAMAAVIEAR